MDNEIESFQDQNNDEERIYRAMYNNIPLLIHSSDLQGRIVSVNDYWLRVLGYTAAEVVGTPSTMYLTETSRKQATALLPELLANGMITNIEAQAVTKTGAIIDVLVGSNLIYSADGHAVRLITTLLDITERKRAEASLRMRESYLTAIIENQPGLIWLKDSEYRFLAVNCAFARSCGKESPEELIGKTDFEVWPQELAQKYRRDDEELMRTGTSVKVEELIFDKGERRWFETFKTPIKNTSGEIIGTAGYANNITARKLEEEALHKVQKLESLGILAGGIAHDFNNLLSGIFGCINLAMIMTTESTVSDMLGTSLGAIDRARALTRQLLTFAKGGSPVKKIENIAAFVEEVARFALSGARVSCECRIVPDLWQSEVDKNQIGQVIDNIIINAQQAMPDGGLITVVAENVVVTRQSPAASLNPGPYIKIVITDSGVGMSAETIPRIFDSFFSTKSEGNGLGLATCYSIIKQHNGTIEVESQPGAGSTFRLYLPALPRACPAAVPQVPELFSHSGTIIIMDDEELIRFAIVKILKTIGYSAIATKNGKEAITALQTERAAGRTVDAMILDLTIPGAMGGKDAIVEIRKIDADLAVYVASGYADDPVMARPQHYGFTDSICKPFTIKELADLLQRKRLAR